MKIKLFFLYLLAIASFSSFGGNHESTLSLKKQEIVPGNNRLNLIDPSYSGGTGRTYSTKAKLIYGRESQSDIAGCNWSYSVIYNLSFLSSAGTVITTTTNDTLTITCGGSIPVYDNIKLYSGSSFNYPQVKLNIVKDSSNVPAASIPLDIRFELTLTKDNWEDISKSRAPSLNYNDASQLVTWSFEKGAEYYELQWVYIDSADVHPVFNKPEDPFLFKEPVKIVTSRQHFDFNKTYPPGEIYFRVRGFGYFSGTKEPRPGTWSYGENGAANLTKCIITSSQKFEANKNWQYVTTYAEEGKYKKVMSFRDGTLRPRQNQINISTDTTVLISEVKYDYEGRGVVNILPVPVATTSMAYAAKFNRFASVDSIRAYDNRTGSLPLDTNYGASRFYSSKNSFINSVNKDYIPHAEGYPYSQTAYTRDNTGRVLREGGLGKAYRFHTDSTDWHFSQYSYGTPSETELKKIFGSNVGKAKHYKKNIAVDPNGQISIQFLDQAGRVVASALGGRTPVNVQTLASNVPGYSETTSLNDNNAVDTLNYLSRSVSKIQNLDTASKYSFNYDLTGVVNRTGLGNLCKACVYDLKFKIIDPDGLVLVNIIETINPPAVTCADSVYSKAYSNPSLSNVKFRKIGEYTVVKELTLGAGAISVLLAESRTTSNYPKYSDILTKYQAKIDSSLCDITCEDHCRSKIKKQFPNYTPSQLDTAIANCATRNCGALIDGAIGSVAKSDCESLKGLMKDQLFPGGFYNSKPGWLDSARTKVVFRNSDLTIRSVKPSVDTLRDPDLFEAQWAEDLFEQHPEKCHYLNCIGDTTSRQYDMQMSRISTWEEARTKGYLNPLGMTTAQGAPDPTTKADPFFAAGARGNIKKDSLVNIMNIYRKETIDNVDYNNNGFIDGSPSGNISIWTYVYYKGLYKNNQVPDANTAWRTFKAIYSAEKLKKVVTATTCPWQPQTASFTVVKKPVFQTDTLAINSLNYAQLQASCEDQCTENVNVWMRYLKKKCSINWIGNDSAKVADSLRAYCRSECGYSNPFAIMKSEDVATNHYLKNTNSTILSYYGCKLDSISLAGTCAHSKKVTTKLNVVNEKTIIYYRLFNEILDTLAKSCSTSNSNCISQAIQSGRIFNPLQFKTYIENRAFFDGFRGQGNLMKLSILNSSTNKGFDIGFVYSAFPTTVFTVKHFELVENFISTRDAIKRVINLGLNPSNISKLTFDLLLFDGTIVPYPQTQTPSGFTTILDDPIILVNQVRTFSVCDSVSNSPSAPFSVPLNFKSLRDSCIAEQSRAMASEAMQEWRDTIVKFENNLLVTHFNKCFKKQLKEDFYYTSVSPKQYHYTLYYYDQAGNLVQTVPPAGVDTVGKAGFAKGVYLGTIQPNHGLKTRYKYNSLNQIVWQTTPDGGNTNFYYNEKGQLRLSQNAKQKAASTASKNIYSYTRYDANTRIVEVGQINDFAYDSTGMYANYSTLMALLNDPSFPSASTYNLTQITETNYDVPYPGATIAQSNLRNRVSATLYRTTETTFDIKTYYNYDTHGNVKQVAYDFPGLGSKETTYDYDLISGKVKNVFYQTGKADRFYHKYTYDADNRIVSVKTSVDSLLWDQDAIYRYYKHGPLARTELGEYKVQGTDYYHTLQGWLKGINTPHYQSTQASIYVTNVLDPGKDGFTISGNPHKFIAQDEFQMVLGYFENDYKGIGSYDLGAGRPGTMINAVLGPSGKKGLYNGNIAFWVHDTRCFRDVMGGTSNTPSTRGMVYQYDQLNRLVKGYSYTGHNNNTTGWTIDSATNRAYNFSGSYDPNGNILSLKRWGTANSLVDNLTYNYSKTGVKLLNNKLQYITDPSGTAENSIGTQFASNYIYDEIGNLTKDVSGKIDSIKWNIYGKVTEVKPISTDTMADLEFRYDGQGNRVVKIVKPKNKTTKVLLPATDWIYTYYVRDASGNILSTYSRTYNSGANVFNYIQTEVNIYGSSRIGVRTPNLIVTKASANTGIVTYTAVLLAKNYRKLNFKTYELTDHLGNVRLSCQDLPLGIDTDADLKGNYYIAKVSSFNDYGPFGEALPGRQFVTGSGYRFGFNGKEKDSEGMGGGGSTYDYGFRIYNPNIGRFLSIDPLSKKYPFYTPYQFAGNTPIHAIDLDGLEPLSTNTKFYSNKNKSCDDVEDILEERVKNYAAANNLSLNSKEIKQLNDDVDDAEDGLWWMRTFKKDWGARNVAKYMLGEGGVDIYSFSELSGNPEFDILVKYSNTQLVEQVITKGTNLKSGESIKVDISTYAKAEQSATYSDFTLALGRTQMLATGSFTITKDKDGNISYSGNVAYTFYDTYDWDPNKGNHPAKMLLGIGTQKQYHNLLKIGAKPFYSRAYFKNVVTGNNSSYTTGEYKDSFDSSAHEEPCDINTIPSTEKVTYDGRTN